MSASHLPDSAKIESSIEAMKRLFGDDARRIAHALKVLGYARKIRAEEGGSRLVVETAAALHDIGIHECERKYSSTAGNLQELEGPPIARRIMEEAGYAEEDIRHVCGIVANHHSAKTIDTLEFRIIWDSDWLVNIPDELDLRDKAGLEIKIGRIFKTAAGRRLAHGEFLAV